MEICDILKWAAGAPVRLAYPENVNDDRLLAMLGIDVQQLIELLQGHWLVCRFLHRASRERPSWCPRHLLGALTGIQRQWLARSEQQMAAMREITAAMSADGPPPLLIKGFSHYALTGRQHTIRFSVDLDLLCQEAERGWEVLQRLGYAGVKHGWHEYGELSRGEITIELHRFFPITSYPEEIRGVQFLPPDPPGRWLQRASGPIRFPDLSFEPMQRNSGRLTYADLLPHATRGRTTDTGNILIPDVTMTAFVFGAHVFWHYLETPFRRPLSLRLATLADIRELVGHPEFDRTRFVALVEQFGARDAMDLVAHLIGEYFGASPLPASRAQQRRPRRFGIRASNGSPKSEPIVPFPQALSNDGCWATVRRPSDLLRPLPPGAVAQRLGVNLLAAGERTRADQGATSTSEVRPERVIVQYHADPDLPLTVAANWGYHGFSLEVRLLQRLPEHSYYMVGVHGDQYSELSQWAQIDSSGAVVTGSGVPSLQLAPPGRAVTGTSQPASGTEEEDSGTVAVAGLPDGYCCQFWFPHAALPRSLRRGTTRAVVLRVMRMREQDGSGSLELDPVVVVPLLIQVED